MMSKAKSSVRANDKILLVLPVAFILILFLTARPSVGSVGNSDFSQQSNTKHEKGVKDMVYDRVDVQPEFPGGPDASIRFLVDHIKYPQTAIKNKTEGKVFISLVIKKDGSVSDVTVLKGIADSCNEEAVRVVKLMPKWKPGKKDGKVVNARFVLPIMFTLDHNKKQERVK